MSHLNKELILREETIKYPRRIENPWRPSSMLCKRFNLLDPYAGKVSMTLLYSSHQPLGSKQVDFPIMQNWMMRKSSSNLDDFVKQYMCHLCVSVPIQNLILEEPFPSMFPLIQELNGNRTSGCYSCDHSYKVLIYIV